MTRTSKPKGACQCGHLSARGVTLMLVSLQSSDKGLPSLSMWNLVAKGNNQGLNLHDQLSLTIVLFKDSIGAYNTDDC